MNETQKQTIAFGAGLVVGAAVGYFGTKRMLERQFDAELDEQVVNIKEHYERRAEAVVIGNEQPFPTPEDAVKALIEPYEASAQRAPYDPRPSVETVIGEVKTTDRNVFDDEPEEDEYDQGDDSAYGIPDFIYEEEVKKRSSLLPYVITDEEFAEGHPGHEQFSLTYYEEDKVLADDQDEVVSDINNTVGVENLLKFGHGSNDSRIVYIRNEKRKVDFEVAQHDGSFAEIIGLSEHNRTGRG